MKQIPNAMFHKQ